MTYQDTEGSSMLDLDDDMNDASAYLPKGNMAMKQVKHAMLYDDVLVRSGH